MGQPRRPLAMGQLWLRRSLALGQPRMAGVVSCPIGGDNIETDRTRRGGRSVEFTATAGNVGRRYVWLARGTRWAVRGPGALAPSLKAPRSDTRLVSSAGSVKSFTHRRKRLSVKHPRRYEGTD